MEYFIWAGLIAPKATPDSVLEVLRGAARRAVADPEFKRAMANVNSPIQYMDAPEFGRYWEADARRLARLVQIVGKVQTKK